MSNTNMEEPAYQVSVAMQNKTADRANSPNKIEPPYPLPFVSRRSLRRVKDVLPIPRHCHYCSGGVRLASHKEVYGGREYGDWPYIYLCNSCAAYVGLHPNTDLPLGTLANAELRNARKLNKRHFITLSKANDWSRSKAYKWLAGKLGIDISECHWSWFNITQCYEAGTACKDKLEGK